MPQKKTFLSLSHKVDSVPELFYRSRFIIVILVSILLLLMSCSKSSITAQQENILQQYFEDNILNHDFRVSLATDNGTDLTPQYSGYTFRLLKNTAADGSLTATNGANNYTGNWSSNDDYSKLVVSLPVSPAEFNFLTREWKFTKKAIPVMELAPWGTTEPKVLNMERL
jgi:hypothetical protein